jgi:hypothetical protein
VEGGCCGDVTRPGQAAHRVPACPPSYGLRVGLGAWPVLSLPGPLERYFIPLERYYKYPVLLCVSGGLLSHSGSGTSNSNIYSHTHFPCPSPARPLLLASLVSAERVPDKSTNHPKRKAKQGISNGIKYLSNGIKYLSNGVENQLATCATPNSNGIKYLSNGIKYLSNGEKYPAGYFAAHGISRFLLPPHSPHNLVPPTPRFDRVATVQLQLLCGCWAAWCMVLMARSTKSIEGSHLAGIC